MAKSTKKPGRAAKKVKSVAAAKGRAIKARSAPTRTAADVKLIKINGKPISNELAYALRDLGLALGTVAGFRGAFDADKAAAFAALVYPDAAPGLIKEKVVLYEKALADWNVIQPTVSPYFVP
jgi:hypothetical protein